MDTNRHLIHDTAFDVYERASYGRGCEIQPITDEKHKQRTLYRTLIHRRQFDWIQNFNL